MISDKLLGELVDEGIIGSVIMVVPAGEAKVESQEGSLGGLAREVCPVEGCKRPESPMNHCCQDIFDALSMAYGMGVQDTTGEYE